MSYIRKLIARDGYWAVLRLPLYPLTLLIWSPVRLVMTLWNARLLADGKWSEYNRFRVQNGINSLFYWTQAVNYDRFGRGGVSPILGLGNYPLRKWVHNSLLSIYAYRYAGAVLPMVSMVVWLGVHLFWFREGAVSDAWGILVLLLALSSTTFFGGAFVFLNYNAMGWAFLPLGLWGMIEGNYWVAAFAWLGASFSSVTVFFVAGALSLIYSIQCLTIWPALAVMPGGIKMLTHFFWKQSDQASGSGVVETVVNMGKAIGLFRQGARYRRRSMLKKLDLRFWYFLVLYLQFGVAWHYFVGGTASLFWAGIGVYIVNRFVARVMDEQSAYMMMFSLVTLMTLNSNTPELLVCYWLVISPLPLMIGDGARDDSPDILAPLCPFHVQGIVSRVAQFLSCVNEGERVLMAFSDPKDVYEDIFDGYRTILEVPLFVASMKGFHFFPDWWAVFDTNYEGAPSFWGRELKQVEDSSLYWQANYVVIYQETGTILDSSWNESGFGVVSELDWGDCRELLRYENPWAGNAPKWWLLVPPKKKFIHSDVN